MEKDIISFNQALELCIIGFNEDTLCMYEIENRQLCLCSIDEEGLYIPDKDLHAPTKSQVFRWFREKYELSSWIYNTNSDRYFYTILKDGRFVKDNEARTTYEEAENACIDKLIEIAKANNAH